MAKLKSEGFDDLIETLENAQSNADNAAGTLEIKGDLLDEIDTFNKRFNTSLTANSSDDDITDYFSNAYADTVQEFIWSNKSAKDEFNKKYEGYASIS